MLRPWPNIDRVVGEGGADKKSRGNPGLFACCAACLDCVAFVMQVVLQQNGKFIALTVMAP